MLNRIEVLNILNLLCSLYVYVYNNILYYIILLLHIYIVELRKFSKFRTLGGF